MIDETDLRIIKLLQSNGRMPYAEIGRSVGLSDAAVRQRVRTLTAREVINIVAVTDPAKLGLEFQAMLGVKVSRSARKISRELGELVDTVYIVSTSGRFDLLVEIVCTDSDDFVDLVARVRSIPGVTNAEVFQYINIDKQTYDWGVGHDTESAPKAIEQHHKHREYASQPT